jgi:hypothetical protein
VVPNRHTDGLPTVRRTADIREGGGAMTKGSDWRDVKAKARTADPTWDADDRTGRRARMREEMLTPVSGGQLAEMRNQPDRNGPPTSIETFAPTSPDQAATSTSSPASATST